MALPLAGVRVLEVNLGSSSMGGALAGAIAGLLLTDLGARRDRLSTVPWELEEHLRLGPAWTRGVDRADQADEVGLEQLAVHVFDADVVIVSGPRRLIEDRGINAAWLRSANPRATWLRIAPDGPPSARETDADLLVQAGIGTLSRDGGAVLVVTDAPFGAYSAGLSAAVGAILALLRRSRTGSGADVETSIMRAMAASQATQWAVPLDRDDSLLKKWAAQRSVESIFECSDGVEICVNCTAPGAFEGLIEALGDEPTEHGYFQERFSGALEARVSRWAAAFGQRPSGEWVEDLRDHGVIVVPVLEPAELLKTDAALESGMAVDGSRGRELGSLFAVHEWDNAMAESQPLAANVDGRRPLEGARVLDFGQYVAGPLAATILADLGAEVVKVETFSGDPVRSVEPTSFLSRRGKSSIALDLKHNGAAAVVERLIRSADVLIHNFKPGVAERLGIGERTASKLNPSIVYLHSTAFGSEGPWQHLGAFDPAVQSLVGTVTRRGVSATRLLHWTPVDVAAGWVNAVAALAGLFRRVNEGAGIGIETTLAGVGAGVFAGSAEIRGDMVMRPTLDVACSGLGIGYRVLTSADGDSFAIWVPDRKRWLGFSSVLDVDVPFQPIDVKAPREEHGDRAVLEAASSLSSGALREALETYEIPFTPVLRATPAEIIAVAFDDSILRDLGMVATTDEPAHGPVAQIGVPLRIDGTDLGPLAAATDVGAETTAVLRALGFGDSDVRALVEEAVVKQAVSSQNRY